MPERKTHEEAVDSLLPLLRGMSKDQQLNLYEQVLDAIWKRTHKSLGEITLLAIVDRVLLNNIDRFPHLSVVKLESSGLVFTELRRKLDPLESELLCTSLRQLVLELLTVLGNLTAEILTPGLHAQITKIAEDGDL
jgi:hypothetical protein